MKKTIKTIIALTILLLNTSIIKAANYIWPIDESNAYETKIEYGYGPRNYNWQSYDKLYDYEPRIEKFYGNQTENHYGVDIIGIKGHTYDVISVVNGTVLTTSLDQSYKPGLKFPDQNQRQSSFDGGGYGNYIVIEEEKTGLCFLYGHLKAGSVTLRNGDKVTQGQKIAVMGSSGDSGHMHLHFEVRKNRFTTTYGINLIVTKDYYGENAKTLNPIDYIGEEAPKKIEEPAIEEPITEKPEIINEISDAYSLSKAEIKNITIENYKTYSKINIEFDKEVEVVEIPQLKITITGETQEANYISNLKGKIHSFIIQYNSFDVLAHGDMYMTLKGGKIIDTENKLDAIYEIKYEHIGILNSISIENTFKESYTNLKGDVNNDGVIDGRDASAVLGISSKLATRKTLTQEEKEQSTRADVNNDGVIDQRDASEILSYYATQSTTEGSKKQKNIIKCDLNNDGKVNTRDYNKLIANITSNDKMFDLNGDSLINNDDIDFFKKILNENGQR